MGREERLLEINAPMDGDRVGRQTWLEVLKTWRERGQGPSTADFFINRQKFTSEWDQIFYELRQPDWWQGDSASHPPQYEEPISNLEASLRSGIFTTVTEIAPPLGAATAVIEKKVGWIKGYVTAANFTDNASASARMSSIACSRICMELGIEPIVQMQARDRTRVVIESDAMGMAGLGMKNLLVVTGDHHRFGPSPRSTPMQFDMDSIQVLWMLRRMRDEGTYLDGRPIKRRPEWFLGAAASPYSAIPRYEALRFEKKINAGAQFIQTQPVFSYDRFLEWLEALDKRNLLGKAYILAGLVPLKSARAAHFMDENVPGVVISPDIIKRMDDAGDNEGQQEVGAAIALELIEKLKQTSGLSGLHIMAVHWEQVVPRLVEESGLPRPTI
jgi:methylenetetrahydrofolate reductase (NADPH)